MKAVKWYCENCGTTVIPGEEIEWDETIDCPVCMQNHMIREEEKPKKKKKKSGNHPESE
jgi:DNA-directed RNA polymerase subunit RPC12/RpoP